MHLKTHSPKQCMLPLFSDACIYAKQLDTLKHRFVHAALCSCNSSGKRVTHGAKQAQHQRMSVRIMLLTDESFTDPCALGPGSTFQKRSVSSPAHQIMSATPQTPLLC